MSITLTGILIADQWDTNGNITGFALLTNDEGKYIVNRNERHQDLHLLLRKKITINGVLYRVKREKIIHVSNFFPEKTGMEINGESALTL